MHALPPLPTHVPLALSLSLSHNTLQLLRTNPHERLPLSQVCTHPWIVRHCGQPTAQELAEVASAVPSSRKRQRVRAAGATGAGGGAGCSSGGARAHAGSRHKPSIAPIAEGEEEA